MDSYATCHAGREIHLFISILASEGRHRKAKALPLNSYQHIMEAEAGASKSPAEIATETPTPASDPPVEQKKSPEQIAKEVLDEREVRVFRPSQVRFDPRRVELPDDFFQPSSEEIAHASKQLSAAVHRLNDAPLMTKKMRDAETAKRMSRFRKVLIRILFPDRVAIQGVFTPQSTIKQVVRFVRAALLDARNVKFHLFVVPPKMKLQKPDATLWSEGLVPAALVHVGIDEGPEDSAQLLKPYLLEVIEDTPESKLPPPVEVPPAPDSVPVSTAPPKGKKGSKKKTPKWFKKK